MELVQQLDDGRAFITDMACAEHPHLMDIVGDMGNYWTRHEILCGWIGPVLDGDE